MTDLRCVIDWASTMSFIKDLITAAAAAFAAFIAWRGLTTWERQTAGQQEHELARRLLVFAFRYRQAIRRVRNPIMWGSEMPPPPPDRVTNMTQDQVRFFGLRGAYVARLSEGEAIWTSLQPDLLEAEALWGPNVGRRFSGMLRLDNELRSFVEAHLAAQDPDAFEDRRAAYARLNRNRRDVIYDVGSHDEPDEFERDLRTAVAAVEAELRPRLLRRITGRSKRELLVESRGGGVEVPDI